MDNITNYSLSLDTLQQIDTYSFDYAVNEFCGNWRNVSTYAHKTYLILFILSKIFKYLGKIIPIHINYTFFYLKFWKWDEPIFIKIELFQFMSEICISVIFIRMIQIALIQIFHFGGF